METNRGEKFSGRRMEESLIKRSGPPEIVARPDEAVNGVPQWSQTAEPPSRSNHQALVNEATV